ncbi:MAG: electron transport complex subunit RsxC [Chromatiales bacterium]|jgi:electron transport complex protein RnfC
MQEQADKLWHFHGGLHLDDHKAPSTREPLAPMRIPHSIVLPMQQHIGEAAEPVVEVGQRVLKGQRIARAPGYISAPVHASTSGIVTAIEPRAVPHPSGMSAPCVVIETDGREEWVPDAERPGSDIDHEAIDALTLRSLAREAGIVGLGGAAFPSAVKLNPRPHQPLHTIVLNGAECEPYIACDDMLMRSRPDEVIGGLRIIQRALGPERCLIGVEDNKPEAYEALCDHLGGRSVDGIDIVSIPTIYPTGGEKQLIKVLTGKEVPSNGLPIDLGIICHNVGTVAALYRAVVHREPLLSRVVTVTGDGVAEPRNLEVLIGTPISEVIAAAGGYTDGAERLIVGGPMMGFAIGTDDAPIVKSTNCILVAGAQEIHRSGTPAPCIRCGECTRVCPAQLLPQQLYWYARAKDFDKVQDYSLFDCIECGCCSYVCPSNIPLVQYYRYAKTEIWAQERDRQKSDLARERHEFRQQRLEREQQEKAARLAKKKAALASKPDEPGDDPKRSAIKEALERVKARKSPTTASGPNPTEPAGTPLPDTADRQAELETESDASQNNGKR